MPSETSPGFFDKRPALSKNGGAPAFAGTDSIRRPPGLRFRAWHLHGTTAVTSKSYVHNPDKAEGHIRESSGWHASSHPGCALRFPGYLLGPIDIRARRSSSRSIKKQRHPHESKGPGISGDPAWALARATDRRKRPAPPAYVTSLCGPMRIAIRGEPPPSRCDSILCPSGRAKQRFRD
jgi:hypothetical protein